VSAERWERTKQILEEALRLAPDRRPSYLDLACGADAELRAEVESLIASHEEAGSQFLAAAAPDILELTSSTSPPRGRMALVTGTKLGPYEIVAPLGAGGMGEVYRARDTKLGRDVALKLLPPQFTADPDRVARFKREARVLASLNHPHVGAIYGFEDADDLHALVLELVEGDTLADRVQRGRLPVVETLTVAQQIADALDAAHRAGIIHRDLKPSNIKITPDGVVKVLDFGLAKALAAEESGANPLESPTATSRATIAGVILGTAAYMSPEQARGQPVDKRTDIWAFGCVLFEMLTGSSPFIRETGTDTIAAVVGTEPEWTSLPTDTPGSIRRLLTRCLQKDTRRRLHDIADARIEIEDAMAMPAEPPLAPTPRRSSRLGLSALSLGIATALAFLLWAARDRFGRPVAGTSPPDIRVTRLTDLPGLQESPAISPDGRSVAFTAGVGGKRQVFMQLIAGGAPLQITRDAVDHECPRWSPDSSSILYFSPAVSGTVQGSIWEIPALGGVPRRVVNSVGCVDVSQTDGRLALFRLAKAGLQLVTAPPDLSTFDVVAEFAPVSYDLYPRWSPDGRWIAFQRGDSIRFDIFVAPANGGKPRQLTRDNNQMSGFAWLPDSAGIVYSSSRGGTMPYLPTLGLWQVTLRDGSVRRVTSGETSYMSPDVSKSGAILVSRMKVQTDIWKFPVDGSPTENVRHGVRVTRQTGQVLTPTVSPDDKEVAFLSDSGGHANLWVVNTESAALRQITHERDPRVAVGVPVWSPVGHAIAFVSSRGNQGLTFGVWLVDADGSNLRNLVNPGLGPAWSPDGRWVYYSTRGGAAATVVGLKKVPVEGGEAVTVISEPLRNVIGLHGTTLYYTVERPLVDGTPEFEIRAATPEDAPFRVLARIPASRVPIWQIVNPALSPDGKWLAQALTDGFTTNIWALSTTTGEWKQITDFGQRATFIARRVSWSSDGRFILAAVAAGDSDIVLLEGLMSVERK
jgi:eukaryotic-like serine/threonine-protein kinase